MNTHISTTTHVVSPIDLVVAMIGQEDVVLNGFGAQPMANSWVNPGVALLPATVAFDDVPRAVIEAVQRRKLIERSGWALLVLAAALLGSSWQTMNFSGNTTGKLLEMASQDLQWKPVSVANGGVTIKTKAHQYAIPVGGRLPNGDLVLSIDEANQSFTTNASTVMIASTDPKNGPAKASASPEQASGAQEAALPDPKLPVLPQSATTAGQ